MGLLTVLTVGLVTALGSAVSPVPPTLYVAPDGSDALDCRSTATACASFDRAYHAAGPGEVVEIAGGTYPVQHFSPDATKLSPVDVVLQAAPGAQVTVGCPDGQPGDGLWPHNCIATEGADHLTLKGVRTRMLPDIEGKGQQGGVSLDRGSTDVTFEDVDAGHIFIASSDSTVRGGDYGPTVASVSKLAPDVGPNITIDGVRFHDHLRMGDQHPECIAMYGAQGAVIRNSRFDNCEAFAIFVTPEPDEHLRDVVIENNFFTNSRDTPMSAHVKIGSHGGSCTNFLIRNNTFVHDGVIAECGVGTDKGTGANLRWIGNIFESFKGGTCQFAPHVFDYNVIEMGQGCGPNDRVVGDARFLDRSTGNLHLRNDSPAIGRGSPTESPATDIDGEQRPSGTLPDAGADEWMPGAAAPVVAIADAPAVVEGGTAKFPVTLSAPVDNAVQVDWETRPANATAPEDYTAASGTLVLLAGQTTGEISVQTKDDALDENDAETFSVRLLAVRGADPGHAIGVGSIADDDLPPTVTIEDAEADEGSSVNFRVRLSQVAGRDVHVTVATADGTAKAPNDYAPVANPARDVRIPAGQLEVQTGVQTAQDTIDEVDETFTLAIAGGGDSATGTIRDDDTAVPSIAGGLAVEGMDIAFPVKLSVPASREIRVRVTTSDGTAKAPADYVTEHEEVVFAPGATVATFHVPSVEDELDEDTETFTAAVSGDGVATGTIVDDDPPPTVGVTNASVSEGGELVFQISLSEVAGRPVKVTASTVEGSAKSPADFSARSAEVTIPAGSTSAEFRVQTAQDGVDEEDETLTVSLSSGASATGTIADDDTAVPSIAGAAAEEGEELAFVVSLSGPSTRPLTVRLATEEGSAKAPADFAAREADVVIPAGELSRSFAVQSAEDALDEDDETFTVSIVGGGGLATGTILDDDAAPAVSVADASVSEGGELVFDVSLSAVAGRRVTVTASTADGPAKSPADFAARSAQLIIPAGVDSGSFVVQTAEDGIYEDDETLGVSLSGGDGATGTIVDDDAAPAVAMGDASVTEGGDLAFELSLAAVAERPVTVTASTVDGSAKSPADFTARSAGVTIPAGSAAGSFVVETVGDELDEEDETLTVSLSSGDGATGTIVDDDTAVASVAGASADEGGALVFAVSLSTPSARDLRVRVATSDGSAKAPADYAAKDVEVVFPAGSTSGSLVVQSAQDALDEEYETFTVSLAGGGLATGTIVDDDAAPSVSVGDASVGEGGELTFAVTLSAVSGLPVKVTASTVDGSAKSPADYAARSADVTIPAGSAAADFNVKTVADAIVEEDEMLTVSLSSGDTAAGAILDDDDAIPSIAAAPADEGDPVQFAVSLPEPSERDVRVLASTSDGTAKEPADYAKRLDAAVLIPAGSTSATFPVPSAEDTLDEDDETFVVKLSTGGEATGTIRDDDAAPSVSVENASVSEGGELEFELSLSAVSGLPVKATVSTADGSAKSLADYAARSADVTIPAGSAAADFKVETAEDALDEDDETLTVALPGGDSAIGTITDDDAAPSVSLANASVSEGGELVFSLTLSAVAGRPVKVTASTVAGSAASPGDFAARSAELTFPAGSTATTFKVQTAQDSVDEPAETLKVALSSGGSAIGTIADDDEPPVDPPVDPPKPNEDRAAPSLAVRVAAQQRTRKVVKRGLPLMAECSEACTVESIVRLRARAARRLDLGEGSVVIGRATAATAGPGSIRLVVKIKSSAARALRKAGALRATLATSAWDAAGNTSELDRVIKLKPKRS